jgi:hypothetical protein
MGPLAKPDDLTIDFPAPPCALSIMARAARADWTHATTRLESSPKRNKIVCS